MRSLRFLVLLAPALLAPLACESSSSPGASPTFEAGPGFEAGPLPEAGPPPDGAPAPPKGVTVTVRTGVTPQPGIRVIFHDAAGLVTSESATDAAGKVAIAAAPSMVTVLSSEGANLAPVTFLGVEDGDNLQVALAPTVAAAGSYEVSFTTGDLPNANSFAVQVGDASCYVGGLTTSPFAVPLTTACVGPANAVLVTASNAGGVVGFGFKKDVGAPGGATVPVGPLALAPFGVTTVTATNAAGIDAELYAIANEQPSSLSPVTPSATIATATGSVDFRTPTSYASAYQTVLAKYFGTDYTALVRREATTAPANATLASMDFGAALPLIDPPTIALTTPTRPEIAFTTPGSLATADAAAVRLTAIGGGCGSWTFLVPANIATFKFPALPTDAACVPSSASIYVSEATFFDASELAGYKAAKTLPISPGFGAGVPSRTRVLPTTGTLRVAYYSNG